MPLFVQLSKKGKGGKPPKKYYINLNEYRNWHYLASNNIKMKYKEIMKPKIEGLKFRKVKLTFILIRGDRRRVDRSNILSIHEKFFCDGLVQLGCIYDDCDDFLASSHYYTGHIDKANPKVNIRIDDMEPTMII